MLPIAEAGGVKHLSENTIIPLQGGSGFLLGLVTGYAVKQIFKAVVLIVGVFIAGLGLLDAQGAITVHWANVFAATNASLSKAAGYLAGTTSMFLAPAHLPITGGFGLGFFVAIRK